MDLSILIPARNEMFLARTIQDILKNIRGDTEIITVLDGQWATPEIEQNERVSIIHFPKSIGQRAATNVAAKLSTAKYVMKVDAHCAFDDGFDIKLMEDMQDDWTVAPVMRNLHAFDWVCPNGHRRYQGPSGDCKVCGESTKMDIIWYAKPSPQSTAYCFDPEPHFQYFNEFKKRPEGQGDLTETMSFQGSAFMLTREKYFELNMNDESWGTWGSQGLEIAIRTWLSGGRCIINHNTWYAHMFRTQGGDFGFPYPLSSKQVEHAKECAKKLFFENNWEKQIHPISWLVEKFWPLPGWTKEDLEKIKQKDVNFINQNQTVGILYYTDNQLDEKLLLTCQKQLLKAANGKKIVSVSLKPIDFGENIVLDLERGYLTMFKQILAGLEKLDTDIIFFAEHDILYDESHFKFRPLESNIYYYNLNCWKVRYSDGHALYYTTKQTSQLCAKRELLLQHYRERVRRTIEKFNELGNTKEFHNFIRRQGFEPGSHGRNERVDNYKSSSWSSEIPNIDIRHNNNLTPSRWKKEQFRDQRNCENWIESTEILGWGNTKQLMERISNGF